VCSLVWWEGIRGRGASDESSEEMSMMIGPGEGGWLWLVVVEVVEVVGKCPL